MHVLKCTDDCWPGKPVRGAGNVQNIMPLPSTQRQMTAPTGAPAALVTFTQAANADHGRLAATAETLKGVDYHVRELCKR